jgi:hypothetical protein
VEGKIVNNQTFGLEASPRKPLGSSEMLSVVVVQAIGGGSGGASPGRAFGQTVNAGQPISQKRHLRFCGHV